MSECREKGPQAPTLNTKTLVADEEKRASNSWRGEEGQTFPVLLCPNVNKTWYTCARWKQWGCNDHMVAWKVNQWPRYTCVNIQCTDIFIQYTHTCIYTYINPIHVYEFMYTMTNHYQYEVGWQSWTTLMVN